MSNTCQHCGQSASVLVTEVSPTTEETPTSATDSYLCERCAAELGVPGSPATKVSGAGSEIWKLLEISAKKARKQAGVSCKSCGLTLAEFRSKGRLGCAQCYEAFWKQLQPLLLRVHNAVDHKGRVPGADQTVLAREEAILALKAMLENAIREEAYESAAELRDELSNLQGEE